MAGSYHSWFFIFFIDLKNGTLITTREKSKYDRLSTQTE